MATKVEKRKKNGVTVILPISLFPVRNSDIDLSELGTSKRLLHNFQDDRSVIGCNYVSANSLSHGP